MDPPDARLGTGPIVATLLLGDVDHSARVHDVVRRIQHTRFVDPLGILRCGELVVGTSDHRRRLQLRDRGGRQRPAQRTRGVEVAHHRMGALGRHHGRTGALGDRGGGGRPDVGHRQPGTIGMEVVGQRTAHLSHPVDADVASLQRRAAPEPLGDRLHGPQHPEGGRRRGVPGAAEVLADPADVGGDRVDQIHVGLGGADVLGRDVAPRETVDEAGVGAHQGIAPEPGRIADDHRLAATLVGAGGRVLVRHPLRQAAHVDEGGLLIGKGVEARATEPGSEHGGVHGHDRPQARCRRRARRPPARSPPAPSARADAASWPPYPPRLSTIPGMSSVTSPPSAQI